MSEKLLQNIANWAEYLAACFKWVVTAVSSFPRKEKYFNGGQRSANSENNSGRGVQP